jgi:dihydropteroate synthase
MTLTIATDIAEIDRQLSKRPIALDPSGYFIIYVDRDKELIGAKYFTNEIDERGLAVDPDTGKPIPVRGKVVRQAAKLFEARTAKELCVEILERTQPCPVSMLDHAAYIGREAQRAEWALVNHQEYVQD